MFPLWKQLRHVHLSGSLDDIAAALALFPVLESLRADVKDHSSNSAASAASAFSRLRRVRLNLEVPDINVATLLSENYCLESLRLQYIYEVADCQDDLPPSVAHDYAGLLKQMPALRVLRVKRVAWCHTPFPFPTPWLHAVSLSAAYLSNVRLAVQQSVCLTAYIVYVYQIARRTSPHRRREL